MHDPPQAHPDLESAAGIVLIFKTALRGGSCQLLRPVGIMHQLRPGPEGTGHGIDARSEWRIHQMGVALSRLHLAVTQELADHLQ